MNRLLTIFTCILISISAYAQKIPNEIILSITSNEKELLRSIKSIDADINYVELKPLCKSLDIYLLLLETTSGSDYSDAAIDLLENNANVEYAYSNQKTHRRATPNDSRYPNQWNLDLIKAQEAWDETIGGEDYNGQKVVIAVMDDGFDIDHEDLQLNQWVNRKEIPNDGMDNDFNGFIDDIHGIDLNSNNGNIVSNSHGTSVVGIIGADSDNDLGVAGINWNVQIMMLSSATNEAKVIAGYDYILDQRRRFNLSGGENGAFVVATNYSLGINNLFGSDHPAWCGMYDEMGQVGIVSVGATTNDNTNVDIEGDLPTTCGSPYFIGVTNSDMNDVKVTNAGYGMENIDLSAPGRNAETIKPNNQYGSFGGTSASAPHVTGALGLLFSLKCENLAAFIKSDPSESALRIKKALLDGTDPLPTLNGITSTGGRLNIIKTMSELAGFCSPDTNLVIAGDLQVDYVRDDNNGSYTVFYKSPDTNEVTFTIYDMQGKKIYNTISKPNLFSRSNERINLAGHPTGVYIASLILGDEIVSYKFRHLAE